MDKITSFKHEPFRFLSNFYPCEIVFEGQTFSSVENAYQAAKTLDKTEREKFLTLTGGKAKRLGKKLNVREDWEFIKEDVMYTLLQQKFNNSELGALLVQTGNAELIEGNHWGDIYWGVCNGVGENRLGKLLMRVRKNLNRYS